MNNKELCFNFEIRASPLQSALFIHFFDLVAFKLTVYLKCCVNGEFFVPNRRFELTELSD